MHKAEFSGSKYLKNDIVYQAQTFELLENLQEIFFRYCLKVTRNMLYSILNNYVESLSYKN